MGLQLDIFQRLESFVLQSVPLQNLLNYIHWDVKFEIHVGKAIVCTLNRQNETWILVPEPTEKPYAHVTLTPEGMETLINSTAATADEFLELALKVYLSAGLKVNITGPLISLLAGASSGVRQASHEKIHQVLKSFGLESLSRKILR